MSSAEVGTPMASCCLSFLTKRSLSLCSFPGCSLYPIPVWIALLQLSLKRFRCLHLATSLIGQFTVQDPLWGSGRRHTDKVTGPTKLVLDKIGLNTSDTCLFQNTAVCSSVLPLDVEDKVKTSLMITFKTFEMAAILGGSSF